jgi:hypothetical protein
LVPRCARNAHRFDAAGQRLALFDTNQSAA